MITETLEYLGAQLQRENAIPLLASALAASVAVVQLMWWQQHRKFERAFGKATYRPKFGPMTALGALASDGLSFPWTQRFTLYQKSKREVITLEPTLWGQPMLYTNSVEVMRQIGGSGAVGPWWKSPWTQISVLYWGKNLLSENDAVWKKYRRILQPAFNPKMYEMVWDETKRLYKEMLAAEEWSSLPGETNVVPHTQHLTQRLALCALLSCGFGVSLGWKEEAYAGKEKVNLDEGVKVQEDNILVLCFAPKWVLNLPFERIRFIVKSTAALRAWFNQAISSKKAKIAEALEDTNGELDADTFKKDIFTQLMLASQMEGKYRLQDDEIIGNIWVMYFAGKETAASVLATTFCFLAVYGNEQDIVLEEIQMAVKESTGGELQFEQYESLVKTRSAFIEALRMIPAGAFTLREARDDTILHVPAGVDADGKLIEETISVPKGTLIGADFIGMQYNPRTFPNPGEYRPSRWYDVTSDDAFTAFSIGPRTCIGRKFALTEGVCFIAHVLRDYRVEPLMERGESLGAWKERVLMKVTHGFTLSIADAPLKFTRR